jgi:hypothetical protein
VQPFIIALYQNAFFLIEKRRLNTLSVINMDIIINGASLNMPTDSRALISQRQALLNLLVCLGYQEPPLAALLSNFHQLKGKWLVATPIYWQATHNDAMIVAVGPELKLTAHLSQKWFQVLASFLSDIGIKMHYHDAETWLVCIEDKPNITSLSPYTLQHHSLMPIFATMDDTHYWQGVLTEIQMLLSNHSLNKDGSLIPINGIWLFGAGYLSATNKPFVTNNQLLLDAFPTTAQRLTLDYSPKQETIVFIDKIEDIDLNRLHDWQTQLTIRWFWNDMAYCTVRKNLLYRLWRHLCLSNNENV